MNNPPRILFFVILFIALFCRNIFASNEIDSTHSYITAPVKVEAEKPLSNSAFGVLSYVRFNKSMIENSSALQISEIISKSPGIFIYNYGGLGAMQTISLRGTNSSQTLILLDGVPVSSSQSGSFDLSTFPISFVESIEIVRGGLSGAVGSSALAGAVNISLEIPQEPSINISQSIGSFNEYNSSFGGNFLIGTSRNAVNFEISSTDGKYPFAFNQFGETKTIMRSNADFTNVSISLSNNSNAGNFSLKSHVLARNTSRGTPGAVLQGRIERAQARLDERESIFTTHALGNIFGKWILKSSAMLKFSELMYKDDDMPSNNSLGTRNLFISRDASANATIIYPDSLLNMQFALALAYSDLRGTMLDPAAGDYARRLNPNISFSLDRKFKTDFSDFILLGGLRQDFFTDNHPAFSPYIGVNINLNYLPVSAKFQISNNFRMPNFNEMYYLNYGTSNLKPEKSLSTNFAIAFFPFSWINLEASLYQINTRNQIVAVPKSPVAWSAQNIDYVTSQGFELSVFTDIPTIFIEKAGFDWSLQNAKNQTKESIYKGKILPFSPQEIFRSYIILNFDVVRINWNLNYSSFRYLQADNDANYILPSNIIMDISLAAPIVLFENNFLLKFQIKNLANEKYMVIKNYPMPGRQFIVSFNYNIDI